MVGLEDDPFLLGETVTFQGRLLLNFGRVSFSDLSPMALFSRQGDRTSAAEQEAGEIIELSITRWWFQTFFIFAPIWGDDPI